MVPPMPTTFKMPLPNGDPGIAGRDIRSACTPRPPRVTVDIILHDRHSSLGIDMSMKESGGGFEREVSQPPRIEL